MSPSVILKLTNLGTGSSRQINAEFDDREWRLLNNYLRYAEEISKVKLFQFKSFASFTWNWSSERGMEVVGELPPLDDITVFLHKLRPVILEGEAASFKHICLILGKKLADDHIRGIIKAAKRRYHLKRLQSMFTVSIGQGIILNSEKALDIWLNGDEYHRAEDLQEQLNYIMRVVSPGGARSMGLLMLRERAIAIFEIAFIVANVVGKKSEPGVPIGE